MPLIPNNRYILLTLLNILMIGISAVISQESENRTLELLGFLPMTGNGWIGGGACLPAALMAVRHVNERKDLLDGYNLSYTWVDTQCNAGLANYKMFEYLQQPPIKIMLLGCGCSTETESTAQVSHMFNITQLSYASSSPTLSDRKRFPNFFRVIAPDQTLNAAKVALMEKFNWKKVATINQALEFFSVVIDGFVKSVKATDISIITQEIFEHDPLSRVENLKKRDARIIITACYEDKARLMLCHAYKVGLYGPKIIWVFHGWYSTEFWRINLDDVPCSVEEMEQAADGAFVLGFYYRNRLIERGIAGLTVPEFEVLFKQEETYDPSKYMFDFAAGNCYDHIWVAALALNCTDAYLKEIGHPKRLHDFSYKDTDINNVVLSCTANVSMTGVGGRLEFQEGTGDPIKDVKIERIEGGHRVTVGSYIMEDNSRGFEWNADGIKWKDGNIPRDSTYITFAELSIPFTLYITMASLAAVGMLLAVIFFGFNIAYRDNRIVKLSSPNINNILLVGCVLTYSTVLMKTTEALTSDICKAKILCFTIGFTLSFGALFSKTWRVYKIFTNKQLLKLTIKDYQLIGIVFFLVIIMVCILIIWEIIGPHHLVQRELPKEVYYSGNDAVVHPFIHVCTSEYSLYFEWTIYIIEGAVLSFGAFLAYETRHVKIEALNDSHQIGMCIYNVVVLSAVGLTLTLLMEDEVIMMYGVTSGCILLGTTTTQLIVFMPKVIAVYRNDPTSSTRFRPNDSMSNSQPRDSSTGFSGVALP